MKRPNSTVLLWLGNALGWIGLGIAAFLQFGVLVWRPAGALPEVKPLAPKPLQPTLAVPEVGARNPFDPGAGRWIAAAPADTGASGELRGVLLLPGVRAAVTGSGAVHVGEPLAGGRLAGIRGGKLLVQRDGPAGALEEIEVPALRSPTLQSLSSAAAAQPGPVKEKR